MTCSDEAVSSRGNSSEREECLVPCRRPCSAVMNRVNRQPRFEARSRRRTAHLVRVARLGRIEQLLALVVHPADDEIRRQRERVQLKDGITYKNDRFVSPARK